MSPRCNGGPHCIKYLHWTPSALLSTAAIVWPALARTDSVGLPHSILSCPGSFSFVSSCFYLVTHSPRSDGISMRTLSVVLSASSLKMSASSETQVAASHR